ncbi:MAG: aspartate-semialdehyde dehydrogenase [Candidatus Gygaella obscura]|nr:aspartate-semialdehyde dehydrogenase [Candidatus Gygaella obscura]
MSKINVAVVGVGAVGEEMLRVLDERKFPMESLRVLARSAREIKVDEKSYQVESISKDSFKGINIALFAGTEGEKGAAVTFAPNAVAEGAVVIDNGADFRMKPDVPLVIPEVNPEDVKNHKGIISNPNCSTIQMVVALAPIYKAAGIKRIVVSSYQAVSGAGRGGVRQLESELKNEELKEKVFVSNIARNVIPVIGGFADAGYTSEEWKMVKETQKILHDDSILISATCVRVPVIIGHSEAVYIETKKNISCEEVKNILSNSKGISFINMAERDFPVPVDCQGKDDVFVGRIRKDPFVENGLWLWVVADNLRKGAATNAIQIAECVISS